MHRHPHILSASTNLLSICFVIIGGLKLTHESSHTISDEIAWGAALLLISSIVLSYLAIRNERSTDVQTSAADMCFLAGIGAIVFSLLMAVVQL